MRNINTTKYILQYATTKNNGKPDSKNNKLSFMYMSTPILTNRVQIITTHRDIAIANDESINIRPRAKSFSEPHSINSSINLS